MKPAIGPSGELRLKCEKCSKWKWHQLVKAAPQFLKASLYQHKAAKAYLVQIAGKLAGQPGVPPDRKPWFKLLVEICSFLNDVGGPK